MGELFKNLKSDGKAIVNYDDNYKEYYLLKDNNNFTYGFNGGDFKITSYEVINHNTVFDVTYLNNTYSFKTNLIGRYNIYNLMSSIVIMTLEMLSLEDGKLMLLMFGIIQQLMINIKLCCILPQIQILQL